MDRWNDNQRNKMMADKLFEQLQRGWIEVDEWTETFISDMHEKTKAGRTLTEKQQSKLEQLFERY